MSGTSARSAGVTSNNPQVVRWYWSDASIPTVNSGHKAYIPLVSSTFECDGVSGFSHKALSRIVRFH